MPSAQAAEAASREGGKRNDRDNAASHKQSPLIAFRGGHLALNGPPLTNR